MNVLAAVLLVPVSVRMLLALPTENCTLYIGLRLQYIGPRSRSNTMHTRRAEERQSQFARRALSMWKPHIDAKLGKSIEATQTFPLPSCAAVHQNTMRRYSSVSLLTALLAVIVGTVAAEVPYLAKDHPATVPESVASNNGTASTGGTVGLRMLQQGRQLPGRATAWYT